MYGTFLLSSRTLWRSIKPTGTVLPLLKQENAVLDMNQIRMYAARKGKRAKLLAAKREKKLLDAAKPVVPKYLPKKSKEHSGKARKRVTDENWLEATILDDIWRTKMCRGKPYSVSDAVLMLQEAHHPTMLNDPEAFVYATVELDLHLKKKNRFMEEFSGTVSYPHIFETGSTNRVIAMCENSDQEYRASLAGAAYVGGKSIAEKIKSGEITMQDFDYVVCHPALLKDLQKFRALLKDRFPSLKNGLLSTNVELTVAKFLQCMEYTANASTVEPDFGWIDVCIGRLNMTPQKIEDNLKEILNTLENKHKPVAVENRLFVTRTLLWGHKSIEKFKIPHWEYLPGYPVNGVIPPEDSVEDEDEVVEAQT